MSIYSLRSKLSALLFILKNKELFIAFYFLLVILGWSNSTGDKFYNEYRVIQVSLLLTIALWAVFEQQYRTDKNEWLFFIFIGISSFFWQHPLFIIIDLLLAYLLYKSFELLDYNELITKAIVLCSLVIFLLLPVALVDYINSGSYIANWYPLSWNIRVYDSYFLIMSIFATWFYICNERYKSLYLLFLFLAFFAILLDAGRSVTLAYTAFIAIVTVYHKPTRFPLLGIYIASWLAYLAITYAASFGSDGFAIVRESSSGRIDLWVNGLQCWVTRPILGCGFYQLEQYPHLSAHPHNIFIQVLTEIGLIGFGFLTFIVFKVIRHISWSFKENYFVLAGLLAVSIDMSLSGVYIYPITQMMLLWFFVFLFKNPVFAHASYFHSSAKLTPPDTSILAKYLPILLISILILIFGYLFMNTNTFLEEMPSTPPRFWGYGYHLL